MMQLRKVCNHPYLIKGAEAEIVREKRTELPSTLTPSEIEHRALVDASGKMIFIDKLLPKLREGHHKVLIFSQMVRVLTIIEEYLVRQAYPFVRIDGSVAENERQTAIEHFNVDDNAFIFLLSTRAGGVGINLTAADTVIIYDSDWNPQNDIQAQARCHRIGQKATVKVYRLITRGTYEQKMFERASRKLGLDHVVLDGGEMSRDARPMKAAEIEEMLRNGVHGIFNEDDTEADRFCAADIDQILSRRAKVYTSDVISGGGSIFAKATFNADADGPDLNAADFWTQVIPASHGFHEQATIRRCRQHKLEMAVTTDIDGAQSSRKIAQRIIERGFRATPGEIQIVRYAMKFCNIADPQLTPLVTQIVGTEDPEAANQAFVTVIGAEAAWAIEDRSPKIIEQILFFARLRRALSFVQRVNIQWPVIPPFWEDPVSEYALAVAVDRYGWRELPAGIGAPELGLKQTKPLGKGQIRVRLTQLIEQLEVQMPEALLAPPDSFEPPLPKAWRDSHPGVLARTVVVDQEIVAVFNALRAFGKPTEDWEELRELARLDLMSASTVKSIGEALIHAAEAPTEDFAQFPLLEPAREFLSPPDLHRLSVSLREMSEIRDFAAKINPRRTEVLKEIRQPTQGPSWWTWECDRALILSVARHGRFKVATWMVDRTLPFRGHFPKAFIEQLERAAEQEETRGKKVRLQGAEDCGFLLREKTRIARCLTVINAVNKVIRQDSENRPSKRPEFPMNVASGVTLVSPGRFVLGNPRYDCKMTPFPVGFCLERKYRIREWPSRLSFRSEIREGKDGPEFVVTCLSEPVESFVGVDSSEAWNQAIETVSKRFAKQGVEGEVVEEEVEVEEEESKHRVIGNVLFGLYNKKVVGELIKLENAGVMKGLQRALADVKPICRAFEIQLPTYVEVNPE